MGEKYCRTLLQLSELTKNKITLIFLKEHRHNRLPFHLKKNSVFGVKTKFQCYL